MTLTDKQRLDRLERSIAQVVTALEVAVGWRPEHNFQAELAEIRNEALQIIEREKVTA